MDPWAVGPVQDEYPAVAAESRVVWKIEAPANGLVAV
jgi:hypothetical protein